MTPEDPYIITRKETRSPTTQRLLSSSRYKFYTRENFHTYEFNFHFFFVNWGVTGDWWCTRRLENIIRKNLLTRHERGKWHRWKSVTKETSRVQLSGKHDRKVVTLKSSDGLGYQSKVGSWISWRVVVNCITRKGIRAFLKGESKHCDVIGVTGEETS